MIDTTVKTFTATIYVGLKDRDTGEVASLKDAEVVCQQYVDEVGLCVTVTPTKYIYTDGNEPGVAVGLIHYPRFSRTDGKPPYFFGGLKGEALELGSNLMYALDQYRVSVVFPDETVMLSNENKA